jgi:hypothetical protein
LSGGQHDKIGLTCRLRWIASNRDRKTFSTCLQNQKIMSAASFLKGTKLVSTLVDCLTWSVGLASIETKKFEATMIENDHISESSLTLG